MSFRLPSRVLFACAAALAAVGLQGQPVTRLPAEQQRSLEAEARLIVDLLQNHHYAGRAFRQIGNQELVAQFLGALDPGGLMLPPDDVDFLMRRFGRSLKTVYLYKGNLHPAFEIYDLFRKRARARLDWIERRLNREFDFEAAASTEPPWDKPAKDSAEADRRWELVLKEMVLTHMVTGHDQPAARSAVAEAYRAWRTQIEAMQPLAIRELFLESIIRAFDPHSGYFSGDTSREFAIEMESAVTGVGLDVRLAEGACVVSAVQPGGPADLQSDIRNGDLLVGLTDPSDRYTALSGLSLREIVMLIRGAPGTRVKLHYRRADSTASLIAELERTRVVHAAQRARGAVSIVPGATGERRIGWIALPSFYASSETPPLTSATQDVRELIVRMQAGGLDGLVLDLRDNPGGLMTEALGLCGLFVDAGVGVHSRSGEGQLQTDPITGQGAVYTGPLVIMVSAGSASASEVFTGTMQFHHRAVVLGGESSFGKGTIQAYVELARMPGVGAGPDWGTLRLTAHQYFLPDGAPVQGAGIKPQLVIPGYDPADARREASLPRALPGERITPPTPAAPAGDLVSTGLLSFLRDQLERNLREQPEWALWKREREAAGPPAEVRSLQLARRRAEWEAKLATWTVNAQDRRELAAKSAFQSKPVRLSAVATMLAAHSAKRRSGLAESGPRRLATLQGESLILETADGFFRELPLQRIDPRPFLGHSAELAEEFKRETGHSLSAGQIQSILQQLARPDQPGEKPVSEIFAAHAGPGITPEALRAGIAGVFSRMAKLDSDLASETPALDIPLREAQRLAAAWADYRQSGSP